MSAVVESPARTEQLAAAIAELQVRIGKLEDRRRDQERLSVDRAPIETGLIRLRAQLVPLEAELAAIVAAQDEEEAAKRAAEEAERQRQREAAEKEKKMVTKTRLDALLAIEDATATLAAAVAAALEADQQVARVNYVLGVREALAGNRIAAYIHTAIRDAGVKMDDFYLGGRHDLVDPSERPQPEQSKPKSKGSQ